MKNTDNDGIEKMSIYKDDHSCRPQLFLQYKWFLNLQENLLSFWL